MKEGFTLQGRVYLLTYQLGNYAQRLVLQMQIINPGEKNVVPWGGNFLLDYPFLKEYFLSSDSTCVRLTQQANL